MPRTIGRGDRQRWSVTRQTGGVGGGCRCRLLLNASSQQIGFGSGLPGQCIDPWCGRGDRADARGVIGNTIRHEFDRIFQAGHSDAARSAWAEGGRLRTFHADGCGTRRLAENKFSPDLLVHPGLLEEFADLPAGDGVAVIVGNAGERFTYASMNRVFRTLLGGGRLLALATNRTFKDADGQFNLDARPFVAALEFAIGQSALILGKPSRDFFASALASMACTFENAVMVGEDTEADVAGARSTGVGYAILVRTGKYRDGDEHRFAPSPSAAVADLAEAGEWILANRM